jgi:acyl-CoA thioester hydrolase
MTELDPGSGKMRDGIHVLPLRVYWEDTDAAGIVYYANYLKFVERGRSDMLRLAGIDQWRMKLDDGVNFVVRRCEIDYLSPARLDDALEIETFVEVARGASLDMRQTVRRKGETLVVAMVRVACLDEAGRPIRLPGDIKSALTAVPVPN